MLFIPSGLNLIVLYAMAWYAYRAASQKTGRYARKVPGYFHYEDFLSRSY
jgi:hypothetical protein